MDILAETVPDGAQNEHVVVQSPHAWLPEGATIFLVPAQPPSYDNHMIHEGQHYHIRNVRVVDGHNPNRTRTAFEVTDKA
ncbi:hypothetical protein [Deinococcus yavapaiensis]|uniref:Uncharacterized protein n=1 Tax=Deinococcus yavapaiensis KR-236 TaxID=694435 RepID=A0A318SC81_9DEIO|nr:hypothetical protein [Deinococcus yavapaiensis]PYE48936.1 hypothetical protein DES52_1262 [Deinococcus yavapaiensis KR-236]